MVRYPLLLLLFAFSAHCPAQSAGVDPAGAGPAARIAALDSLIASEGGSPEHYQALGNAHFAGGDYGRAILQYERGLRLRPGHQGLRNNLRYVRAEAGINRAELKGFFLQRWWRATGAFLGAGTAFWLAQLCWWLAVAGGVTWYLRRRIMEEKKRFALLPVAATLLGFAVLFFLLGTSRNTFLENDREAILLAAETELRVAPGPDATLEESLTQGLKLRVLDEFAGYVKIALEDGKQGWVPAPALERI